MPKTPLDFETQRTEVLRLLAELDNFETEGVLTDYLMQLVPEDEAVGVMAKFHASVLTVNHGLHVMPEAGKAMVRLGKLNGTNQSTLALYALHLAVDRNAVEVDRIWKMHQRGDKLLNEVSHYGYYVAHDMIAMTLTAIYNSKFFYELRNITHNRPVGSFNDKKINLALKWFIVLLGEMLEVRNLRVRHSELAAV